MTVLKCAYALGDGGGDAVEGPGEGVERGDHRVVRRARLQLAVDRANKWRYCSQHLPMRSAGHR